MFHVILVVTDTGGPHQSISNLYTCLTCATNIPMAWVNHLLFGAQNDHQSGAVGIFLSSGVR